MLVFSPHLYSFDKLGVNLYPMKSSRLHFSLVYLVLSSGNDDFLWPVRRSRRFLLDADGHHYEIRTFSARRLSGHFDCLWYHVCRSISHRRRFANHCHLFHLHEA